MLYGAMTDAVLNAAIAGMLPSRLARELAPCEVATMAQLHREWMRRHPDYLPPCMAHVTFPPCYDGPRQVYYEALAGGAS